MRWPRRAARFPAVPALFRGVFRSLTDIRESLAHARTQPCALGGEREGVVLRMERAFPAPGFPEAVCKSVRPNHVQTDEHRTRHWKPCRIAERVEVADHQ